ncbi:MAG: helicase-associated domain-containing protein [Actinomycetota bacterium]
MTKTQKTRGDMTLSQALRGLPPDDLAAVLTNRPETSFAGGQNPQLALLASTLARPDGVRRAIAALDEFRLQLLIVAVWCGPEAPLADLRRQTGGVDERDLAAGARGLARCALAFPLKGPQGWALWVPACVMQVVENFAEPGRRIRPVLETLTVDELAGIARNLGIDWARRPRKDHMLGDIMQVLSDPQRVAGILEDAPTGVHDALALIRAGDGATGFYELQRAGLAEYADYAYGRSFGGDNGSPLAWLKGRGLVLWESPSQWSTSGGVLVGGEVECALRGGTVFPAWQPQPPPMQQTGAAGVPERGPEQIVAETDALIDLWASTPAPRLKTGGLGVRELRKAAKRTGIDERLTQFIYALAVEEGLLCHEGEVVTAAGAALEWAHRDPAAKWASLFDTWRRVLLWSESEDALVSLSTNPLADHSELRTAVLLALADVPPGASVGLSSLGRRLSWMRPQLFHCESCAAILAERVVAGLVWLGVAQSDLEVSLLEPARSALSGPGWTNDWEGAAAAFSPPVDECTVQADLTVIVPGPPLAELGRGLARFTDLEASSPARVYRISESSLRRALDLGTTREEMTSLLERFAPKGVPQTVRFLIEDVARRHGRITVGEAGLYVRTDEPALLAELLADRRIQKLDPRTLAPTVAVVSGTTVEALLKSLRTAGYMPVAENGGARVESAARQHPIVRRGEPGGRPPRSPEEARSIAVALLGGTEPAPTSEDERVFTARADILQLLRRAERDGLVVELAYRTSKRTNLHEVEPVVVNRRMLSGWSLSEQIPKNFEIARIDWARLGDRERSSVYGEE